MYKNYIKDEEMIRKLEELHEKKYRLLELIRSRETEPFVVELCGMPRTGKTVSTEKIFEFFRMANFKVVRTKEPAQIVKEKYDVTNFTGLDFNDKTLEISRQELRDCKSGKPDIILQDRGVFDNYIWYQMMYENGEINIETYIKKMAGMSKSLNDLDQLFLMTADPEVIIQRDYSDQIFLEERKKTTVEGVTRLKNGMAHLIERIESDKLIELDNTNITTNETSIFISNNIIDGMAKKYILK
ncbi:MAG: AAA family ATPase [Bacilli bacterium]|nr:AAA family ATPase [Bacilli bacterium]